MLRDKSSKSNVNSRSYAYCIRICIYCIPVRTSLRNDLGARLILIEIYFLRTFELCIEYIFQVIPRWIDSKKVAHVQIFELRTYIYLSVKCNVFFFSNGKTGVENLLFSITMFITSSVKFIKHMSHTKSL